MADALHWVVPVRIGFTTESVQSITSLSATFVAVSGRSGVRAGTKHRSPAAQGIVRIPSVRCVFSQQQQQQKGCNTAAYTSLKSSTKARFCTSVERRKWAVDTAIAAQSRAVGAPNKRLPPYIEYVAI